MFSATAAWIRLVDDLSNGPRSANGRRGRLGLEVPLPEPAGQVGQRVWDSSYRLVQVPQELDSNPLSVDWIVTRVGPSALSLAMMASNPPEKFRSRCQ